MSLRRNRRKSSVEPLGGPYKIVECMVPSFQHLYQMHLVDFIFSVLQCFLAITYYISFFLRGPHRSQLSGVSLLWAHRFGVDFSEATNGTWIEMSTSKGVMWIRVTLCKVSYCHIWSVLSPLWPGVTSDNISPQVNRGHFHLGHSLVTLNFTSPCATLLQYFGATESGMQ